MGQILKVEIVKNQDGQPPSAEWHNRYHLELTEAMEQGDAGGTGIESDALAEAVEAILFGEEQMHRPDVRILRAVISTPEEGDEGHLKSVRIIPWGKPGRRVGQPDDEPLPLESVVKISFAGASGRTGANQYRGVLWQSDVELEGGAYRLKANASGIIADALMMPIDAKQLRQHLRQVKLIGELVTSRAIVRVGVVGISTRQRTQKKRSNSPRTVAAATARIQEAQHEILKSRNVIERALITTPAGAAVISAAEQVDFILNGLRSLPLFGGDAPE